MKMTTRGLDGAKPVFQLHGIDEQGRVVLKKALKRTQVLPFFAHLEPCRIGMEACGSAHHWARRCETRGHTVKLMAPQLVKPYGNTNTTAAADAEAICEAVSRPSMRFVPVKTNEPQAVLALHRARQGVVKARTAQANHMRGRVAEYGMVIPQGINHIGKRRPDIRDDGANELPGLFRHLVYRLGEHLKELDRQVDEWEAQIQRWHREHAASQKRAAIPGIGPLTASALVAASGNAKSFTNGRQLAPWLGLVPRQHSSGGKPTLLGIRIPVSHCLFFAPIATVGHHCPSSSSLVSATR